jgi:hypothetical protein
MVHPLKGISDNSVCLIEIQSIRLNNYDTNTNMVNRQIVFNNSGINTFINEDINTVNNVLQVLTTGSTAEVDNHSHSRDSRQYTSSSPEVGVLDVQTSRQGNVTECAQITHDYDITDYDKGNVAWCSDMAYRG